MKYLGRHDTGGRWSPNRYTFCIDRRSSAHFTFKDRCLRLNEGDTQLTLKQLSPVRLVKNEFFKQVEEAETRGASVEELRELLGKGRAKKGIFEGDIYEGEVEIGQIASSVHSLKTAEEVIKELINDFNAALNVQKNTFFYPIINNLHRFIFIISGQTYLYAGYIHENAMCFFNSYSFLFRCNEPVIHIGNSSL